MEKTRKKTFNLAISTDCRRVDVRNSCDAREPQNIFKMQKLESVDDVNSLGQYEIIADREIREIAKKIKKSTLANKRLFESGVTFSRKSYTIRSMEANENYLTRDELMDQLKCKIESMEATSNLEKTGVSKLREKHALLMQKSDNKISQQIYKNRMRIEQIQESALKSEMDHISPTKWMGTLRKSGSLNEMYNLKKEKMERILPNGLKMVARSKKRQELEWLQSKRQNSTFMAVASNNAKKSPLDTRRPR